MVAFRHMDRLDRMDDAQVPPFPPPHGPVGGVGAGGAADPAHSADSVEDLSTPEFLAQRVLSPRQTGEQGRAIQLLWELHAEPIAQKVASRYRNCVGPEFVGNAFGHLWEKLIEGKYDWRRGSFKGWWRTVLTNQARDAWDAMHAGRPSVPLTEGMDPAAPPPAENADTVLEALKERLADTRRAMDALSDRQELRSQVNYYAVFLIELRRALVSRLRKANLIPGLGSLCVRWKTMRDSDVLDQLLPWRDEERPLAFRPDLNDLADLWDRLRPLIDQPPHDLGAEALCARITSRASQAGEAVTRDVWYNWKRHLRSKLAQIGVAAKWEEMLP